MIFVTFRRTNGPLVRLAIHRDDDQALDFVLARSCREFGDPSQALPPLPQPRAAQKSEARR